MIQRLKDRFKATTLATKIRYSYILLLVPVVLFLVFCFYNLWNSNRRYEDMVNSTVVASEFNLDFKKDFDYEAYLLIVGNKSPEQSKLHTLLSEAGRVLSGLEKVTDTSDNSKRLTSIRKYLSNLETYVQRIEENLAEENQYEKNMEIWENDIQIVTQLVQDAITQYTYYEAQSIQQSRTEYQNFFVTMIRISIVAFILILLLTAVLSYVIPRSITRPIKHISEVTDQVAKGDLSVRSEIHDETEAGILSDSLNAMIDKINELLDQVKTEQIRLRKTEFELLQAQINPHFLYNTLDAIIWLAESGEQKKVVSMVGSLSEFFRTSLNQGKDIVSVREELQHVRSYLEIQQVRYQDILKYEIDVPEELNDYAIPKITIQPLVENALYHGIKNKRGLGQILVKGEVKDDCFEIRIDDNGIGIDPVRLQQVKEGIARKEPSSKDIYGLYSVNERIRLNFGDAYGITIESSYGVGTLVTVRLPRQNVQETTL